MKKETRRKVSPAAVLVVLALLTSLAVHKVLTAQEAEEPVRAPCDPETSRAY
jgi:hypothetical protein